MQCLSLCVYLYLNLGLSRVDRIDYYNIFKSRLLRFVRPLENSVFACHNPIGIKYLTRIRLGFSHLRYHKFKHGFLDAIDPLCSCNTGIENTVHYFLHCSNFSTAQNTLLNEIAIFDSPLLIKMKSKLFKLSFMETQPILIKYILEAKRFEGPIFWVD